MTSSCSRSGSRSARSSRRTPGFLEDFVYATIYTNLFVIAFNLLSFGFLDGARAWKILPLWRDDLRGAVARRKRARLRRRKQQAVAGVVVDLESIRRGRDELH